MQLTRWPKTLAIQNF